jgi:DNA-binding FadR family transcriptional regulator
VFRPVTSEKVYMNVVRQVRQLIADGTLRPGDKLPAEREFAATLSVSRASLRQAISALQAQGLIEIRHGDGNYVARSTSTDEFVESFSRFLTEQQIGPDDILQARRIIECGIARLCARTVSREHVARLKALVLDEKRAIGDRDALVKLNRKIHLGIAEGTGNAALVKIMEFVLEMMRFNAWPHIKAESYDRVDQVSEHIGQHEQIVQAITEGDGESAAAAMATHLEAIADELATDLAGSRARQEQHPEVPPASGLAAER